MSSLQSSALARVKPSATIAGPMQSVRQVLDQPTIKKLLPFLLLALMLLLWAGLTWGLRSLRRMSLELDEVESGAREGLSAEEPGFVATRRIGPADAAGVAGTAPLLGPARPDSAG